MIHRRRGLARGGFRGPVRVRPGAAAMRAAHPACAGEPPGGASRGREHEPRQRRAHCCLNIVVGTHLPVSLPLRPSGCEQLDRPCNGPDTHRQQPASQPDDGMAPVVPAPAYCNLGIGETGLLPPHFQGWYLRKLGWALMLHAGLSAAWFY